MVFFNNLIICSAFLTFAYLLIAKTSNKSYYYSRNFHSAQILLARSPIITSTLRLFTMSQQILRTSSHRSDEASQIAEIPNLLQQVLSDHKIGDFEKAKLGYERLLALLSSANSDQQIGIRLSLHGNIGSIYMSEGDTNNALRHFEQAIALNPRHGSSQYNLAVILTSKLNQHSKALKHCALAMKYDPENHKVFHLMGNIMQNLGKIADAEKYFNIAEDLAKAQSSNSATLTDAQKSQGTQESSSQANSLHKWLVSHTTRLESEVLKTIDGREYRMKYISRDPLIILVDQFLTEEECQTIRQRGESLLERSFTMGSSISESGEVIPTENQVTREGEDPRLFRSSYTAWLPRDTYLHSIQSRLAELLNLSMSYIVQKSEDLQVVKYNLGGQFKAHQDSSAFHPRLLTALLYLNDITKNDASMVFEGETWFPFASISAGDDVPTSVEQAVLRALDIYDGSEKSSALPGEKIVPTIGRAVIFSNYAPSGEISPLAVHAGLPIRRHNNVEDAEVNLIEKWIANYWVELDTQLFQALHAT